MRKFKIAFPLCLFAGALLGIAAAAQAQNPVPVINQPLKPPNAAPGTPGLTLSVSGTGFTASSIVSWNGAALPTTFISQSLVTATVDASQLANPGAAVVTVANTGTPASNGVTFEINTAISSVAFNQSSYSVGNSGTSIAVADFNGDGFPDIAVTGSGAGQGFNVLLNNGNGTFGTPIFHSLTTATFSVTAGDFNNDGKIDLAIAGVDLIYIVPGNGDGTFGTPTKYGATTKQGAIAAGDFKGDGNLDVAFTNYEASQGFVGILINGGVSYYQVGESFPEALAVGDFNLDGKLDIAVACSSGHVALLFGNGDGTFRNGTSIQLGTNSVPFGITTADFNGDGKLDLAVTAEGSSAVDVLLGNGNGTFQSPVSYTTGSFPYQVVAGDFNDDNKLGLAVVFVGSGGGVSLLAGNGDGTFKPAVNYSINRNARSIAAGDFDNDGALDVVAGSNNGLSVLLQSIGPKANLTPPSLSFPTTVVGQTSSPMTATLTNSGNQSLNISSITLSAGFTASKTCGTSLAAGASCTIDVSFAPAQPGAQTGTLSVFDDAAGSPQTVSLSGTGAALGVSPSSLSFGSVPVGQTSSPQTLTITNGTKVAISVVFSITIDAQDFPFTNTCSGGTVPAQGSCTVSISFKPLSTGTVNSDFVVQGGGTTTDIPMSGTGT